MTTNEELKYNNCNPFVHYHNETAMYVSNDFSSSSSHCFHKTRKTRIVFTIAFCQCMAYHFAMFFNVFVRSLLEDFNILFTKIHNMMLMAMISFDVFSVHVRHTQYLLTCAKQHPNQTLKKTCSSKISFCLILSSCRLCKHYIEGEKRSN